jgi:Bacterial Ig domain
MKTVLGKCQAVLACSAVITVVMMSLCTKQASLTTGPEQLGQSQVDSSLSISILSPSNGQVVNLGDTVQIFAEIGDSGLDSSAGSWHGTVSFYQNGVLIGKDSTWPYQCWWKPASPGAFSLTAKAVSGSSVIVSAPVAITVRDAFISITSPYNYQTFSPGDTVRITATPINTSRHTVRSVEFYRNGTLLAAVTQSPFVYIWKNAALGTYTFRAVAHDTKGKLDTAAVTITVVHYPPQVWISQPANGDVFYKGDTVHIAAMGADSAGSISRVAFYKNNSKIGMVAKPSPASGMFELAWYDTTLGTFVLSARAYDNTGDSGISQPVTIVRKDDFIVLTSPRDGQTFRPGSTIPITASAVETKYHTVKNVKFLRNNRIIATLTAAPYSYSWKNAEMGSYQIKAIALDTKGKSDTSAVASITVQNDSSALYLFLGGPTGIVSAVYAKTDTLTLWAQLNDSSQGAINSISFYENNKLLATRTTYPFVYSRSLQNTALGTYKYYAVAVDTLGGTITSGTDTVVVVSTVPKITITGPDTNALLHPNDTVTVSAALSGFGIVSFVKFFVDSAVFATDSTTPYSGKVVGLGQGYHSLHAVAFDGTGRGYSSNYLSVYIQQQVSYDPAVYITSPLDSAVFSVRDTIQIKADASSPYDSISMVRFYRDSVMLGTDYAAPFSFAWKNPAKGTYFLKAVATDTKGRAATSPLVKVMVQ